VRRSPSTPPGRPIRIAAGLGTVFFGLFAKVGDYRLALLYAGFLFLPVAGIALLLPDTPEKRAG
jgi:hypothetical protein